MTIDVKVYSDNGIIYLESKNYNLKIDNNRMIYIKDSDSSRYKYLNTKIKKDFTVDEKKKVLYNLYLAIERSLRSDSGET